MYVCERKSKIVSTCFYWMDERKCDEVDKTNASFEKFHCDGFTNISPNRMYEAFTCEILIFSCVILTDTFAHCWLLEKKRKCWNAFEIRSGQVIEKCATSSTVLKEFHFHQRLHDDSMLDWEWEGIETSIRYVRIIEFLHFDELSWNFLGLNDFLGTFHMTD